jgi:DNA-binding winged helix-turn-helix (wHTH) protein
MLKTPFMPAFSASSLQPALVAFGPFTFDRANGLLRDDTRELPLPPRVLGVLDLLVSRAGAIVPKQEIIDSVWKDAFVTDTSLSEAISVLRQALGDDPQAPHYIQTVHRRGYRFVAQVDPIESPAVAVQTSPQPPAVERRPSTGRELVPWSIAILSIVLAVVAVWQYAHFTSPDAPIVRMRVEPLAGTHFDVRAPALALSPDGLVAAWSGCDITCRLYVRSLDQLDAQAVPGTEGASAPFFSADGRSIGFFADGKLRKVARAGGLPLVIAEAAQPFGAVWMPDGEIIFASSERGGLQRVSDRGGNVEQLTIPSADAGEVRHAWPALAPGGRALLFTIAASPAEGSASRIALLRLGQRSAWQTIIDDGDMAQAVSPDYIAFSRRTEIHAIAFDRIRQAIAGADEAIVSGIGRAEYAVSVSGAVVFAVAAGSQGPSLSWIPPSGSASSADLAALLMTTLAPDGSRVAGISGSEIWTGDVARGTTTRLTHGGTNVSPVWSSDGSAVYYASATGGAFQTWIRDSSSTSAAKLVLSAAARHRHTFPTSTSRDGRLMAYTESGGPTRGDVKVVQLSSGATVASIETAFDETNGALSPDGRFLAYQSDESGRWEIYVLSLQDRRRVPISSSGGGEPVWSGIGGALFYRAPDALVRVAIDASGQPTGAPIRIPESAGFSIAGIAGADDRILVRRTGEQPSTHAVLTLEWARELHRILGPPTATLPR